MKKLAKLARACLWHLPETPYPSDHPWDRHHDPARPRG